MALVLRGGTLYSAGAVQLQRADLGIDGSTIAWIGPAPDRAEYEVVDCAGKVIVPGNVCGHTHLYSALARGLPPPPRQPRNFPEILELIWWRLDRALDEESIRLSALSGAVDAILSGTTTLIDHHASPNSINGSLDVLAEALDIIGVRASLCYEVTDRNGSEGTVAGLRENERFARENRRPRMRGMVGAHASFTLEDRTLEDVSDLAGDLGVGVHIHVAEDVADEDDSLRRCGKRTAYRLQDAGVLTSDSLAAHCVHLDEGEREVVRTTGTWVAHNCRSNLNNSVGRAPAGQLGERVLLGTDGIDGDMFAESRTAFFRAREEALDASAEEFTGMLSRGADFASELFGVPIGRLEPGAAADLVVLDYDPPTPLTAGNVAWHWMFAMSRAMVRSVMVDGAWVVRDRALLTCDEERVRWEAREAAQQLWRRMETM